MGRWDAVILGSGVGGLAAASALARGGLKVLVLEKNSAVGGACAAVEWEGFQFDVAVHLFASGEKGVLGEALRRAGERVEFLPAVREDVVLRVGRTSVEVPGYGCRGVEEAVRDFAGMYAAFGLEFGAGDEALVRDLWTLPGQELDRLDRTDLLSFIGRYPVGAPALLVPSILSTLYTTSAAGQVAAGEFIRCYQEVFRNSSLSYVRGGASAIPEALGRAVEASGGEVRTRAPAGLLRIRGGRVEGVETRGGFEEAPVVVSTAGLRETVFGLAGEGRFPADYLERVRAVRTYNFDTREVLRVALRGRVAEAKNYLAGDAPGAERLLRLSRHLPAALAARMTRRGQGRWYGGAASRGRLWLNRLLGHAGFGIAWAVFPTHFDPDLAPPGRHILLAVGARGMTWPYLRRLFPGLSREVMRMWDPSTRFYGGFLGKAGGPPISNPPLVGQAGRDRLPNETPVEGLYLAGDSAGGRGIGTEMAARSGLECADKILAARG
ncbi:MAG: FAD-dependent oxidoreductase [Halobacteria archaeon]